jgi:hypothetical protein
MTDFMNLKINQSQSFGHAHKNRVHIYVFIGGEYSYIYEYYCEIDHESSNLQLNSSSVQ